MPQTNEFYCLDAPDSERLLADSSLDHTPPGHPGSPCPANSGHSRSVTPDDDSHLDLPVNLVVKHNKQDQLLIWTWPPWPCLVVHDRLIERMQSAGLSGYALRPATVRFRNGSLSTEYKRLLVTGWGGIAPPESGIRLIRACPGCLAKSYSALTDPSSLVDSRQWTGDDFFVVWPLPYFIFITSRAADTIKAAVRTGYKLLNLDRCCSDDLVGGTGFGVGSLGESFPRDLALKYGGPLGIA